MLIKLVIIFAIVAIILIFFLLIDRSREGQIARARRVERNRTRFERKVVQPLSDKITDRAKPEKVQKIERQYKRAGIKISYAASKFIELACSIILFFLGWRLVDNIYLGIVGLVSGWFLPNIIIGAISNSKIEKIDEPIGQFMKMTVERYRTLDSFRKALISTIPEMRNYKDFYQELLVTAAALDTHEPVVDALYDLADRCENRYLWRYADLYRITEKQGTKKSIEFTLMQVVKDHDRHMKDVRMIKRQLNGITMESKFMLGIVLVVIAYGAITDPYFTEFYLTTNMGKASAAAIAMVWLFCLYLVLYKLGAPLDKEEEEKQ